MARKFLTNVDLAGNQLLAAVVEVRSGDPASGKIGQVYYNSTSNRLRLCVATGAPGTWVELQGGPITSADIQDGTITNADIAAAAAIARSKLDFGGGLVNGDIATAAAIARSKLDFGAGLVNADIATGAAIALSKLAVDPLARANHTGTQTAATISDFNTQRDAQRLDQHAAPTSAVSFNNQRITSVADPSIASDAATKNYVDGAVSGFDWKPSARVASTGNVGVASPGAAIDGISLAAGDRVVLKNQTAPAENGIYIWNAAGTAMTRAADADAWNELYSAAIIVEEGTANADTAWLVTSDRGGTLGTTAVTIGQFPGAGAVIAGNGMLRTGNTLDVGAGTGIAVGTDTVAIDTAVVARKYAAQITGDAALVNFTVTHGLGTNQPIAQVYDDATGALVDVDVVATSTTVVTVSFASAPAVGVKYRVTVIG